MRLSDANQEIIKDFARSVVSLTPVRRDDLAVKNLCSEWRSLGALAVKYPRPTISICWRPIPRAYDITIFPNLSCDPVRLTVAPFAEAEARAG